jgi:hypothetical protein
VSPTAGLGWRGGLGGSDPTPLSVFGPAFVIDRVEEHIPDLGGDDVIARQLLQLHPIGL